MKIKFSRQGQEIGEYPEEAVPALLQSGVLLPTDHYWHEAIPGNQWAAVGSRWAASVPPPAPVSVGAPPPPTTSRAPAGPVCRTCGQGTLVRARQHRMSGPAVVIGYILLIPSLLGMLIGFLVLLGTCTASTKVSATIEKEARTSLEAQKLPESIITEVIAGQTPSEAELAALTPAQRSAVDSVKLSLSASKVGAGAGTVVAGGVSLVIIITSFVGGLLGWLLVMKKTVLRCTHCQAVVAAS
jgi:hypothetical protein